MVNHFLSYSSKFCTVRPIWFCSNFTSMWSKYLSNNYVFPQCAELAGALRGRRHFSPCRRNGLFPFYLGATLHIQVTIIMVRCVFCHLGDFLSNWVAWPLCLSLNYSLDLSCSFLPCIFSVILQFAFKLCGYGGSIFPTHHTLMFPGHHFTLSSILKVFTLLIDDYSRKHIFIVFKNIVPICNNLRDIYLTGWSFKGL